MAEWVNKSLIYWHNKFVIDREYAKPVYSLQKII